MIEAEEDRPVAYIDRTRAYYAALGYDVPYRWARNGDAPFQPLPKALAACTVALVTTAAPIRPDRGDQGPGAPYNGSAKFFDVYSDGTAVDPRLGISHVAYDRDHARADDQRTWFPLPALREAAASGRIGRVAARFHGLPTNRSHRATLEVDGPALLARCREDGADAAFLVPNCPVCHQSVTLAARHLERHGVATVVMGAAKDIVEAAGAPRFLFSDVPLGNAAGLPGDSASQALTLDLALRLLEAAPAARTVLHSPVRWSASPAWKADYANPARLSADEIALRRAEFDREKRAARAA